MIKYKVWLHIEEIDEDEGHYEDLDVPESVGGELETEEEARDLRSAIINQFD